MDGCNGDNATPDGDRALELEPGRLIREDVDSIRLCEDEMALFESQRASCGRDD